MASTSPKPVRKLPSVFADPSPVVREPAAAVTGARPRARESNGVNPGRDLALAARAVVAAIELLARRREALAELVAAARASELSDELIRGHLVVSGLDQADVDAALA